MNPTGQDDELGMRGLAPPTMTAKTESPLSSKRKVDVCRYSCIKVALKSLCVPSTIDLGLTNCQDQEICCQVASAEQKQQDECSGGEVDCIPKVLFTEKCNVNATLADPGIMARKCPYGAVCCSKKRETCPPTTHFCLPLSLATACQPGSTVHGACLGDKVCCQLAVAGHETTTHKMSCEGVGRCLAPYLTAECKRLGKGSGTFSAAFSCANPRLTCCVNNGGGADPIAALEHAEARGATNNHFLIPVELVCR